jgi:hypothetical protein
MAFFFPEELSEGDVFSSNVVEQPVAQFLDKLLAGKFLAAKDLFADFANFFHQAGVFLEMSFVARVAVQAHD